MHCIFDYKMMTLGSIKYKLINGYNSYLEFIEKLKNSDTPYCYFVLRIPVKLKLLLYNFIATCG